MRRSFSAAIAATIMLAACAPIDPPKPQGYVGPVAQVQDMMAPLDTVSANVFFVAKVDGQDVRNGLATLSASRMAETSNGLVLEAVAYQRNVAPVPATFTIEGRTHFSQRFIALFNGSHDVTGEVHFTPQADHVYAVKGVIGSNYSAVWIIDVKTGEQVSEKIERRDS